MHENETLTVKIVILNTNTHTSRVSDDLEKRLGWITTYSKDSQDPKRVSEWYDGIRMTGMTAIYTNAVNRIAR